uniref:SHSP domain-containing protein n=1 Tax=Strongyloides venezuelensis TaxID=75913 RepID=A0A0K0G685_STRVS
MSQPKIFEDKEYCHSRKELYMDSTGQYRPRQSKSLGRPYEIGTLSTAEPRQWHSAATSRLDVSKDVLSTFTNDPAHTTKTPITQCYPVVTTATPLQPKTEIKIRYHDPNFPTKPVSLCETGEVTIDKDIIIDGREEQEKVFLIEDDSSNTKIVTPILRERSLSNSSDDSTRKTGKGEIIYKTPNQKTSTKRPAQESFICSSPPPVVINQSSNKIITKSPSPIVKKGESMGIINQRSLPSQVKHTKTYSVPERKVVEIPTKVVDEHVKTPSTLHKEICDQVKRRHSVSSYRSVSHSPVPHNGEPAQKGFAKSVVPSVCRHRVVHCDQVPRKISQVPTKTIPTPPSQLPTQVSNHVVTKKPKSPPPSTIYKLQHQVPQPVITKVHCQTPPPGSIVTEVPGQIPRVCQVPTKFSYKEPSSTELKPIRSPSPVPTQEVITKRIFDKTSTKRFKSPQSVISQEQPIKTTTTHIPRHCSRSIVIDKKSQIDQNGIKHSRYQSVTQKPSQVYRSTTPVSKKVPQSTTQIPTQVNTSTTPATTKVGRPTTPIPSQVSKSKEIQTKDIPIQIIDDKYPYHHEPERPISQISQKHEDKTIPIKESHYEKTYDTVQFRCSKSPVPSQSSHYYTPHSYHKTEYHKTPTPVENSQHISQQTYRSQSPAYPKQISQVPTTKSFREDGKHYSDLRRSPYTTTDSYLQQQPKYEPIQVQERHHESIVPTQVSEHAKIPPIYQTKTSSTTPAPIKETFKALPAPPPKVTTAHETQLTPVAVKGEPKYAVVPKGKSTYSKLKSGTLIHEIEEVDSKTPNMNGTKHDDNNNTKQTIYSKPSIYTPSRIDIKQPTDYSYNNYELVKYQEPQTLSLTKELDQVPLSEVGIRSGSQRQYSKTAPKDNEVIYAPRDNVSRQTKEPTTTYYAKEPETSYYTKEPTKYYRRRSPSSRKIIEEEYTRHYKKTETTDEVPERVVLSPEPYYEGRVKGQKGYYTTTKDSPNVSVTTHYKKQSPSRPISRGTIPYDDSSDTDHHQRAPSFRSVKERKAGSPERLVDEGTILSMPDGFKIILDTSHFHSNDVKITMYDHTLQLEGKHYEVDKYTNDTITRSFVRKYSIPTDIDMNSISAAIDDKGIMTIVGYYKKNTTQCDDKSLVYKF